MDQNERNGLQEIIDDALAAMAAESGVDALDPSEVNLAELCRRTGLTRSRARTRYKDGTDHKDINPMKQSTCFRHLPD